MKATISLIKGDGIGVDVSEAAMFLAKKAMAKAGIPSPMIVEIAAGASYFAETGNDIQPIRCWQKNFTGEKILAGNLNSLHLLHV